MPLNIVHIAGLVLTIVALAGGQPSIAAAVTATLLVLVVAAQVGAATVPATTPVAARTLRHRARRTAFLPQLNPDAPGRPRPRAPSPA